MEIMVVLAPVVNMMSTRARLQISSMATSSPHNRTRSEEDDDDDPVDRMISRTGCSELHYSVQECMAEHQDWRK
ncbi:hypothetical protein CRUP_016430 [Coryphaenoides rupestris]|nr:hypothetical protein CRUP_016430 [Coryphaenoides rupestris]